MAQSLPIHHFYRAKQVVRTLERSVRRAGLTSAANTPTVTAWRAQRRAYFSLLHKKRSEFWTARFDADQTQPRRLWRSFDELLGRCGAPPTTIDAAVLVLHRHFDDKVAGVRAATAGAEPPTFTSVPVGCVLRIFSPITIDDVEAVVRSLPVTVGSLVPCFL